jgi:hypothetical protein
MGNAGPRDKEVNAWVKKQMGIIWCKKYQPAMNHEVDEFAAAHPALLRMTNKRNR